MNAVPLYQQAYREHAAAELAVKQIAYALNNTASRLGNYVDAPFLESFDAVGFPDGATIAAAAERLIDARKHLAELWAVMSEDDKAGLRAPRVTITL